MGEVDVLKMIQTLPGIKTVGEASSGYNVRGSAADQNLLLFNNGTIYNPNHLFGFFTAFNSDMIKDAELYKSSIPSQYGGRIASVLNITSKEANKEKFTGSAGIGLVTSKLNLEIPIIKEKTSLLLSGRTTYSDWIMKTLPNKSGYRDGKAGFYDLGTVFSHTLNERNKLNVYGYYSHDRFAFNDNEKYAYNNMNFSANWRTVFAEKLTGNFSFGYDHYDYRNDETVEEASAARLSFAINQWFGKADFLYQAGNSHAVNFGLMSQLYNVNSSANIHSSVSGKVNKIDNALDASGYKRPAIYIDVEGDEWEETIDRSETLVKECALSSKEIVDKIAASGIVGLGGATFPTQVKLMPPPGNKAEIVIINAVECEPYLTSDHSLMLEKGEQILVGVTILMKAVNVNKAVIGIENNKPDAIAHLQKLAVNYKGIEIMPLKVQYPQGGEKQLIDAVIRRQVKSGALPISAGAVVQNVGTAYAVYEAVQKNKPLFERVVTITGKAVANPSNFLVRMGTPISCLIEAAGGLPENTGKIIGGGPMMGKALISAEVPVCKGSSGVLLLTKEESVRKPIRDCIRCAKCVGVCPMGLNPTLLMNATEFQNWELAEKNYITDCIECGSCSYTCPANRPLLDQIRLGKGKVMGIIRSRKS